MQKVADQLPEICSGHATPEGTAEYARLRAQEGSAVPEHFRTIHLPGVLQIAGSLLACILQHAITACLHASLFE